MPTTTLSLYQTVKHKLCSTTGLCRDSIASSKMFPHPVTTTNSRAPDIPRTQTHTRSSSGYSLTGSEIYDVNHRGQGLSSDNRLAVWYIETPVHVDRHLQRNDGVRLVTYVGGRRAEGYAILLDRAYHDEHYDLFFARIDTIFVSISPLDRGIELAFANNHTPAYTSGFVTILVHKAIYKVAYIPQTNGITSDNILGSEEDKPVHATAFLVASDTLPIFAREYALPYLPRIWGCIIHAAAFPVDNNAGSHRRVPPHTPAAAYDAAIQYSLHSRFSID